MKELLKKLEDSGKSIETVEDLFDAARELGYDKKQVEEILNDSLSDEDLEKIAGGLPQTLDQMLLKTSNNKLKLNVNSKKNKIIW